MLIRIVTGLILAAVTICAVFFFPMPVFMVSCGLIVGMAAIEWLRLARLNHWLISCCYLVVLAIVAWLGLQFPLVLITITSIGWLFIVILLLTPLRRANFWCKRIVLMLLGLFILASAWVSLVVIREFGAVLLFYLIVLIPFSDVAAYFAGRFWGKHLLSPTISPKKTIEGLLGGVCVGLLTSMCVIVFFPIRHGSDYLWWGVVGIGLILLGVCGDLFESLIKRRINIKDSGALLPGHGGVLDRIDSIVATLPVYFLVLTLWGYIPVLFQYSG